MASAGANKFVFLNWKAFTTVGSVFLPILNLGIDTASTLGARLNWGNGVGASTLGTRLNWGNGVGTSSFDPELTEEKNGLSGADEASTLDPSLNWGNGVGASSFGPELTEAGRAKVGSGAINGLAAAKSFFSSTEIDKEM